MIVVDASVVLEVLLQTSAAESIQPYLRKSGESLAAPHLIDVEVSQALRRYARSGEVSPERGATALRDLAEFPIYRFPHQLLLQRIWAFRQNLTAYDAAYVALAELLECSLVTRDHGIATAAKKWATVELV